MTYSLNTLNSAGHEAGAARPGWRRFADEVGLFAGLVLMLFWLLALLSYSPQDAAWSTSGAGAALVNRAGRLGALLADASYYLLGFSVWWCVAASIHVWIGGLVHWLRAHDAMAPAPQGEASVMARFAASRAGFWCGLLLLLSASAALEWTRLYSLEPRLPGHAGGVLGFLVGPLGIKWLGFSGSGLLGIAIGLLGAALVFRFSWGPCGRASRGLALFPD